MEEDRVPGSERAAGEAAGGLPARQHALRGAVVLRRGRGRRVAPGQVERGVRQVPDHGHGEKILLHTVLCFNCMYNDASLSDTMQQYHLINLQIVTLFDVPDTVETAYRVTCL